MKTQRTEEAREQDHSLLFRIINKLHEQVTHVVGIRSFVFKLYKDLSFQNNDIYYCKKSKYQQIKNILLNENIYDICIVIVLVCIKYQKWSPSPSKYN